MDTLRDQVTKSQQQLTHLTGLLRESEATTDRLEEQAKVLKEEIRRLERNAQRADYVANLEYLKNVIVKVRSGGFGASCGFLVAKGDSIG